LRLDRSLLRAPFGQEAVEGNRIDHGAGQYVRADLGALLDHDDASLGRKLLEVDRSSKPGGSRADDHTIEFHRLARGKLSVGHDSSPCRHFPRLTTPGNRRELAPPALWVEHDPEWVEHDPENRCPPPDQVRGRPFRDHDLKRDDFSSSRHPALVYCWSMTPAF